MSCTPKSLKPTLRVDDACQHAALRILDENWLRVLGSRGLGFRGLGVKGLGFRGFKGLRV